MSEGLPFDFPNFNGHFGEILWTGYLGRGRYGNVFHGYLVPSERDIVVKEISGEIDTKRCRETLCRWRFLDHVNILMFYDFHLEVSAVKGSVLHLMVEYAKHGSLQDYLLKHLRVPEHYFIRWSLQMTRGLRFLHWNHIIHGHMKSSNVLLDSDFNVKLCDFGYDYLKRNYYKDLFVEASWIAPEVLRGVGCDTKSFGSFEADVYALGVVLWEMTTCDQPFKEKDNQFQIMWISGSKEGRPRIPGSCPEGMAGIIQDCWHQDPVMRPSVQDVLERLEAIELPPSEQKKT